GARNDLTSGQGAQKSTAARLAAEFKVNEKTIRRDGEHARCLDTLAENCGEEIRRKVLAREVKVSRAELKQLAEKLPSEQKPAVRTLLEKGNPAKPPPPRPTPPQVCLSAWQKVPGQDRPEAVRSLLADEAFAAVLKEVWPGDVEDDEEYRGE